METSQRHSRLGYVLRLQRQVEWTPNDIRSRLVSGEWVKVFRPVRLRYRQGALILLVSFPRVLLIVGPK